MTDELDTLRRENEELKWHIRVLTRKQEIPDMVAVDFIDLEEKRERGQLTVDELWAALMEMKDAYQVHDNSYNFLKNAIWAALDGAPDLTETEHHEAHVTVVGVIEKLMAAYKAALARIEDLEHELSEATTDVYSQD